MAKAVKPKKGKGLVKTLKGNLEWHKNELRYEKKLVEQLKLMNETKKDEIRALQTMLANHMGLLWALIEQRGGSVEVPSEEWQSAIGRGIFVKSEVETNTFLLKNVRPSEEVKKPEKLPKDRTEANEGNEEKEGENKDANE